MTTDPIIDLAQWIADFLRRHRPKAFTKNALLDVLGKDIHKATFADAVDLARNNYTIIAGSDGFHYAKDKREWLEYCQRIENESIDIYTKTRSRRRLDPERPPQKITIREIYQREMML